MELQQYVTAYDHDKLGLGTVHLAVVEQGKRPVEDQWIPAYRDLINNVSVVWIRSSKTDGELWIRDEQGTRRAKRWP